MSGSGNGLENSVRVPAPLERHQRVAVDANVLIALLEDDGPRADRAALVIDAIEAGIIDGVAASIALTEVLVQYAHLGDAARFEMMSDELRGLRIEFTGISSDIAVDAAWVRTNRSLSLADAIHVAAARAANATAFVTNDRRIRSSGRLEVLYLDDLPASSEPSAD